MRQKISLILVLVILIQPLLSTYANVEAINKELNSLNYIKAEVNEIGTQEQEKEIESTENTENAYVKPYLVPDNFEVNYVGDEDNLENADTGNEGIDNAENNVAPFKGESKLEVVAERYVPGKALKERVEKNVYEDVPPITEFSFSELEDLAFTQNPTGALGQKLEAHLKRIYVNNRLFDSKLNKPYLRVGHWNIERGFNIEQIIDILNNPQKYKRDRLPFLKKRHIAMFDLEVETLSTVDVPCLNEADIGMPRTQYKNIVTDIADTLGWNYAYSTEFIEVGPFFHMIHLDQAKYKGLHGTVVLSRFPIVSTELIELPQCYDWYEAEVTKHLSPVEHLRRFGAKYIFREHLTRKEVRHGGRKAIAADIKLPTGDIVTIVSTHFEDRAFPDCRVAQFKALLEGVKNRTTPVIIAGDFNTSTTDTKPTSVNKEVFKRMRDPDFIARTTGSFFIPGLPILSGFAAITFSKLLQYKDPVFPHIPVGFPNHERKFFKYMKAFKFNDGNSFDLSGDKHKTSNGKGGLLANSNQRHWKGFKSTYRLEEPRIIAYFKLDWFFVKPVGEKFRPFNGSTLKTLNKALEGGISDHNPITVDIQVAPIDFKEWSEEKKKNYKLVKKIVETKHKKNKKIRESKAG